MQLVQRFSPDQMCQVLASPAAAETREAVMPGEARQVPDGRGQAVPGAAGRGRARQCKDWIGPAAELDRGDHGLWQDRHNAPRAERRWEQTSFLHVAGLSAGDTCHAPGGESGWLLLLDSGRARPG